MILYTWVDVENILIPLDLPDNIISFRCYWDGAVFQVKPNTIEQAQIWLKNTFSEHYEPNHGFILESLDTSEYLAVFFEETTDTPPKAVHYPIIKSYSTIWNRPKETYHIPSFPLNCPQIYCFYSYKGGVGKTYHSLKQSNSLLNNNQSVLLIDTDLESPGLSLIFEKDSKVISYSDFVNLIHCSIDYDFAINLIADKIKNSQQIKDNFYFLPCFRDNYTNLNIRPEHFIQGLRDDPFAFTNLIASLGMALSVDNVILDLHSGVSNLSWPFILDPRLNRVIVTTLDEQSIRGTERVLEFLAKSTPNSKVFVVFSKLKCNNVNQYIEIFDLINDIEKEYFLGNE